MISLSFLTSSNNRSSEPVTRPPSSCSRNTSRWPLELLDTTIHPLHAWMLRKALAPTHKWHLSLAPERWTSAMGSMKDDYRPWLCWICLEINSWLWVYSCNKVQNLAIGQTADFILGSNATNKNANSDNWFNQKPWENCIRRMRRGGVDLVCVCGEGGGGDKIHGRK